MYHFIVNPKSRTGKGNAIWNVVKQELDILKVSYSFHLTRYKFHATEIAKEICEQYPGVKNIVILGGDGTVNEVINGITCYDEVILGYIPSGSSNDLARSLKIPTDPIIGLQHILSPSEFKYVDTGLIYMKDSDFQRKFAVSTGVGFDAAICEEVLKSNLKKTLNKIGLGKLTYILVALKQLLSTPFMDGEFIIDGVLTRSYKQILLITGMIHKYEGGGMRIVPTASPFDGKLSVCIVHGLSKLRLLSILPTLLVGKHTRFKGVEIFDCQTLSIHLHKPVAVHVDGECPGYFQYLEASCTAKQLRIII